MEDKGEANLKSPAHKIYKNKSSIKTAFWLFFVCVEYELSSEIHLLLIYLCVKVMTNHVFWVGSCDIHRWAMIGC